MDRVDSNGILTRGAAPEPPARLGFWPVYEVDGEPCDPDLAASLIARGEAEYDTANLDADTDRARAFQRESRALDGYRYDAALTIAAKIEMRRLREEFASVPSVLNDRGEFVDAADGARYLT